MRGLVGERLEYMFCLVPAKHRAWQLLYSNDPLRLEGQLRFSHKQFWLFRIVRMEKVGDKKIGDGVFCEFDSVIEATDFLCLSLSNGYRSRSLQELNADFQIIPAPHFGPADRYSHATRISTLAGYRAIGPP